MPITPKITLLAVILLSGVSLLIDLPKIPLKFSYENFKIDTEIGGYSLNLFGGRFVRDLQIKQGLDIKGGVRVTLNADMSQVETANQTASLESARAIIERRINSLGVSEPSILTLKSKDYSRIVVELPGVTDPQQAINELSQVAFLEFRQLKEGIDTPTTIDDFEPAGLSGKDLKR
ncbi:MAG: hypothetical protein ABIG86_01520, partial [Patescibacteria group bacterium]